MVYSTPLIATCKTSVQDIMLCTIRQVTALVWQAEEAREIWYKNIAFGTEAQSHRV